MQTEVLVRNAKNGDKDALVRLIMGREQDYYKLAYVYTGNREDALDAMEDMIVILYENIERLKKDEAFYSWSRIILVNCCKNLLRKKRRIVFLDTVQEMAFDDDLCHKDEQIVLEAHLSKLTAKHQEVLKLRFFLDWDYQTISDILKIPVGTVKSRISVGLKKLKESLGGEK